MNIQAYLEYCLSKPGVTEDFPFDEKTLVFKVCGKMFALVDVDFFKSINLKCDPNKVLELRASYSAIKAGYHMNKKHWNTIENDGSIEDTLLFQMTDDSYNLVVQKLTKKEKDTLSSF